MHLILSDKLLNKRHWVQSEESLCFSAYRGRQKALIFLFCWAWTPIKLMGVMWRCAPQNHSLLFMTPSTIKKETHTFPVETFIIKHHIHISSWAISSETLTLLFWEIRNASLFPGYLLRTWLLAAFIRSTVSLRATTSPDWHRMERSWRTLFTGPLTSLLWPLLVPPQNKWGAKRSKTILKLICNTWNQWRAKDLFLLCAIS